jgi:hypothetical protein
MDKIISNINNTIDFAKLNERRGLYRVWVPLHDDGKAPLISIWIDPAMTAIELCHRDESGELAAISEDAVSEEIEDHLARIAA